MKSFLAIILISIFSVAVFGHSATKGASSSRHHKKHQHILKSNDSGLKTEHQFDDQVVNGKYQYPDEAIATVEDEKVLDDLLSVRKDFKDRIQQSAGQR